MPRSRRERTEFLRDLTRAAALPLAVGVVLVLMLLHDTKPQLFTAALESIRRVIQ